MSLAKAAPKGLKDLECKKITILKCPPIPNVPKKDCVQETVSAYKDQSLKTHIGKGTELQVPIWHSRTYKAFLIHMGSALGALKKKGHFKTHKDANKAYMEQCTLAKQATGCDPSWSLF